MANITTKSTKQEILDAYNEMKAKLDAQNVGKDDPIAQKKTAENEAVIKSADNSISEGIFNPEIIEKYKNLKEAIELKQLELNEVYKIETVANSLVAIINAHKDKEAELKAKYDAERAELNKDMDDYKNAQREECEKVRKEYKEMKAVLEKEYNDRKQQLEIERKRDAEEYEYQLNKQRRLDNDEWEAERQALSDEMDKRIEDLCKRENKIVEKEQYVKELEAKVEAFPQELEDAKTEGIKKGKDDANKSNVFEVRAIKNEYEYKVKTLEDKVESLTTSITAEIEKNKTLQMKLDDAYAQMKELAAETVRSTGGVKILNNDNRTTSVK